jgi:hypothetical protein
MNNKGIIDSDWPLSLGWRIKFCSTNKHFTESKFLVSKKKMTKSLGSNHSSEGMAACWNESRVRMIAINYNDNSFVRFMELINHEISHIVDYILADASIEKIDTELRAYLHDWILGHIMRKAVFKMVKDK